MKHGVCKPAASGFRIFMRFFANRASTRYAHALERGDISPQQRVCGLQTALFSSLHIYSKQRKRAGSGLTLNACFLTQLAGKRVGRGRCGPNPRKAGHLVCLRRGGLRLSACQSLIMIALALGYLSLVQTGLGTRLGHPCSPH